VLGKKKDGLDSIRIKATSLGIDVPDGPATPTWLARVKELEHERRGLVTDDEASFESCGGPGLSTTRLIVGSGVNSLALRSRCSRARLEALRARAKEWLEGRIHTSELRRPGSSVLTRRFSDGIRSGRAATAHRDLLGADLCSAGPSTSTPSADGTASRRRGDVCLRDARPMRASSD